MKNPSFIPEDYYVTVSVTINTTIAYVFYLSQQDYCLFTFYLRAYIYFIFLYNLQRFDCLFLK